MFQLSQCHVHIHDDMECQDREGRIHDIISRVRLSRGSNAKIARNTPMHLHNFDAALLFVQFTTTFVQCHVLYTHNYSMPHPWRHAMHAFNAMPHPHFFVLKYKENRVSLKLIKITDNETGARICIKCVYAIQFV